MEQNGKKTDHRAGIAIGILIAVAVILLSVAVFVWIKAVVAMVKSPEFMEEYSSQTEIIEEDAKENNVSYLEFYDAIREDLNYSVTKEYISYNEDDEDVSIIMEYPVLSGNIPNLDYINEQILNEYYYYEEYYEETYHPYI